MKVVKHLAQIDREKCTGDKHCEKVCPSGAIKVVERKAIVDADKCVACFRCQEVCPTDAVEMLPRSEPIVLDYDHALVDQQVLNDLCYEASLHPSSLVCGCGDTRVKDVAAAVVLGAKTPEEICLMTGTRSGCGFYCMSTMLRLLKANGIEVKPPDNGGWYDLTSSIWDLSEETLEKYPQYFLKEDKAMKQAFKDAIKKA